MIISVSQLFFSQKGIRSSPSEYSFAFIYYKEVVITSCRKYACIHSCYSTTSGNIYPAQGEINIIILSDNLLGQLASHLHTGIYNNDCMSKGSWSYVRGQYWP